jgi:predicted nucleotidyltransferase
MLVYGSFATNSYEPSGSDIDLISIAEVPRSDRFMGVVQGIRVDVYTGTQADLERVFRRDARDNNNSLLYAFVRGRSLYDPQGIVSHLTNLATHIWHDGPASPSFEEAKNLQNAMQRALVNADRLELRANRSSEWREMAHIYSSKLFLECIYAYCRMHRLWASAIWEMLKWDDPRYCDVLQIIGSYLVNPSLKVRLEAAKEIAQLILADC